MALNLPERRQLQPIQARKRNVPIDQIIAVRGQSPIAAGIETAGNVIGQVLARKAELRRQGEQLAQLEGALGVPKGTLGQDLDPGIALQAFSQRTNRIKAEREPLTGGGYFTPRGVDPTTGKQIYSHSKSIGLFFDDGSSYTGGPLLPAQARPNKEAVSETSRAAVLLPKVDKLQKTLEGKSEIGARASLTPIIGPLLFPEEQQLINEAKQAGFAFGGKSFTGVEEQIIRGAMIPGPLDNKASRTAKIGALKGYLTGQMDLYQAANLLGPAGNRIKSVLKANTAPSENSAQRKARLLQELQGAR